LFDNFKRHDYDIEITHLCHFLHLSHLTPVTTFIIPPADCLRLASGQAWPAMSYWLAGEALWDTDEISL